MSTKSITIRNLSKAYTLGTKAEKAESLVGAISNIAKAPWRNFQALRSLDTHKDAKRENTLWALRDVSFEIDQGEVTGIIGRNGAGKSTLLKVLSRITEPTSGHARMIGRMSSLLEVGTGFHPDLTGRENVYMNGTILGMSKLEIDRKFEEIVDFSGVELFLDTPVKRYSSGMQVRLAFAVAAHLEPEILIIDEVLAVGDAAFQDKCMSKMQGAASDGKTVILVSHNMDAVSRLCSKCAYLKTGELIAHGDTETVMREYLKPLQDGELTYPDESERMGSGEYRIQEVQVVNGNTSSRRQTIFSGDPIEIEVIVEKKKPTPPTTSICLSFLDQYGRLMFHCDSRYHNFTLPKDKKTTKLRFCLRSPWLNSGTYNVSAWLSSRSSVDVLELASKIDVPDRNPYLYSPPPSITREGFCKPQFELEAL